MASDRELDAIIAEKLFGWRWLRNTRSKLIGLWPPEVGGWVRNNFAESLFEDVTGHDEIYRRFSDWDRFGWNDRTKERGLPRYSESWEAMRLVIEEVQQRGWHYDLCDHHEGGHVACFCRDEPAGFHEYRADSAPIAVCRAALMALGVTYA